MDLSLTGSLPSHLYFILSTLYFLANKNYYCCCYKPANVYSHEKR